jgi:hypothetical protein
MANKTSAPVEESTSWEDRYAMSGFFNVSSMAEKKIAEKRRRKGLGTLHPREKNVYGQLFVYSITLGLVKTIGAPLERMRIIMQTRHMANVKPEQRPAGTSAAIFQSMSL